MAGKIRKKDKINRSFTQLPDKREPKKDVDLQIARLPSHSATNLQEDVKVRIIDSTSRRSWILLHVAVPNWQLDIEDWFHVFSTDDENLKLDYNFSQANYGIADERSLIFLLNNLTKYVLDHYFYFRPHGAGIFGIVDRFNELDKRPHFWSNSNDRIV
jgi:hypothetical protein